MGCGLVAPEFVLGAGEALIFFGPQAKMVFVSDQFFSFPDHKVTLPELEPRIKTALATARRPAHFYSKRCVRVNAIPAAGALYPPALV